ncbi:MAG: hypothetical protein K0S91_1639 [Nitrososphaeraceae archaeon]|jgi:hypothetical protein|nr:hypothetical protein [Nitrososphaeraceae archaeon]
MFCFYCDIIIYYYYIIIVSTSKIAYHLIDQAAGIIVLNRYFYEFYIFPNYLYNMKNINWPAEDL